MQIDILELRRDLLGECPLWDARSQSLYWIDGRAQRVRRHTPATGASAEWHAPQHIGSIALCESGRLLLALEHDFWLLDPDSGAIVPMDAGVTHAADRMRLNDGRTDRAGRFVVGSMTLGRAEPEGALYQLTAGGAVKTLDTGIAVPMPPASARTAAGSTSRTATRTRSAAIPTTRPPAQPARAKCWSIPCHSARCPTAPPSMPKVTCGWRWCRPASSRASRPKAGSSAPSSCR